MPQQDCSLFIGRSRITSDAMLPLAQTAIVLSFNAINTLIPIIVIVILIGAAAGLMRGLDIFNIFGFGALMGLTSGAARGRAKGLAGGKHVGKTPGKVQRQSMKKKIFGKGGSIGLKGGKALNFSKDDPHGAAARAAMRATRDSATKSAGEIFKSGEDALKNSGVMAPASAVPLESALKGYNREQRLRGKRAQKQASYDALVSTGAGEAKSRKLGGQISRLDNRITALYGKRILGRKKAREVIYASQMATSLGLVSGKVTEGRATTSAWELEASNRAKRHGEALGEMGSRKAEYATARSGGDKSRIKAAASAYRASKQRAKAAFGDYRKAQEGLKAATEGYRANDKYVRTLAKHVSALEVSTGESGAAVLQLSKTAADRNNYGKIVDTIKATYFGRKREFQTEFSMPSPPSIPPLSEHSWRETDEQNARISGAISRLGGALPPNTPAST